MPDGGQPDLSRFLDILKTLEKIEAPYMIIGAFAGTLIGITRVTLNQRPAESEPEQANRLET